jgi:hypothetical protein
MERSGSDGDGHAAVFLNLPPPPGSQATSDPIWVAGRKRGLLRTDRGATVGGTPERTRAGLKRARANGKRLGHDFGASAILLTPARVGILHLGGREQLSGNQRFTS